MIPADISRGTPLDVAILVLEDSNTLSFAAAVDPMRAANRFAPDPVFRWHYVTADGAPALLTSAISVPGPALMELDRCDLLIVVGGFNLDRHATPALLAGLRRIAARGAVLAGIDGGPWILARAGLLDGHTATPHWEDLEAFRMRFPDVITLPDRFRVSGARMTSGGALPAIDMMLDLIARRFGTALAARVAGVFIHDAPSAPTRPQRRFGPDPRHNRLTRRAAALMEETLDTPLPIPALARQIGTGTRTLELNFRDRLGTSPRAHYLALRLAEARRLVTDTDMRLTDVALATGFASPASFSRAFRAAHGTSARALRG